MQHYRICITRCGYATVAGNTEDEALRNAKNLDANDFDWESVNPDLIKHTAEIVEPCGPNGEVP